MMYYILKEDNLKTDTFNLNFVFNIQKDEILTLELMQTLLLEGTILNSKSSIKKSLLNNYNSGIAVNISYLNNRAVLRYTVSSLNKKYLPNNEDVYVDTVKLLLDTLNNNNILAKNITSNRLKQEKNYLLDCYAEDNTSIDAVIDKLEGEEICDVEKAIKKIKLEDVQKLYKKILLKGKVIAFEITSNEESLQEYIIQNMVSNEEDLEKIVFKNIKGKAEYIENEVKNESPYLYVVLKNSKENITKKDYIYMTAISSILDKLVFDIVREEYGLSYDPNAYYSVPQNAIIINGCIANENKELALSVIEEIILNLAKGNIEEELINTVLEKVYQELDISYYTSEEITNLFLENYLVGIELIEPEKDFDLTLDKIVSYMKNLKVELIYNLKNK